LLFNTFIIDKWLNFSLESKSHDVWHWMIYKKLTKMSVTAHSSINNQDLVPILRVWPHIFVLLF